MPCRRDQEVSTREEGGGQDGVTPLAGPLPDHSLVVVPYWLVPVTPPPIHALSNALAPLSPARTTPVALPLTHLMAPLPPFPATSYSLPAAASSRFSSRPGLASVSRNRPNVFSDK